MEPDSVVSVINTGIPLIKCLFLGSKNRLLLAGNSSTTRTRTNASLSPSPSPSLSLSPSPSPSPFRDPFSSSSSFSLSPLPRHNAATTTTTSSSRSPLPLSPSPSATASTSTAVSVSPVPGSQRPPSHQGVLSVMYNQPINGIDGRRTFREKTRYYCAYWGLNDEDSQQAESLDGEDIHDIAAVGMGTVGRGSDSYGERQHYINDVVVFGSSSLRRSFVVAVGGSQNNQNGVANVQELQTGNDYANLVATSDFLFLKEPFNDSEGTHSLSESVLTSADFCPRTETLAIASESGRVFIYDTAAMKLVSSFQADEFGLKFLKFTSNGFVATCGLDCDLPIKVFDLREPTTRIGSLKFNSNTPTKSNSSQKIKFSSSQQSNFSQMSEFSLRTPLFSCLRAHPGEDKLLTGNTAGCIGVWDFRVNASINFPCHHTIVTDIAVHPQSFDRIISSAKDGRVNILNARSTLAESIFQDGSLFTSIAVEEDSSTLAITSEDGKVWQLPLPNVGGFSPVFSFA